MARLLFSKNIFIFSSLSSSSSSVRPLLFRICHFSISLNHKSSLLRRLDYESRNIPVSVWWDFENCNPPADVNVVFRITHFITEAVRAKGIKGPLQIKAFGDVFQLSRPNQEALASTGINLIHVPRGGKNSADRSLLIDLMYWVSQNPPPAHLFLISGDKDFAEILHRLRMNNYNILIAGIETSHVLCSVATIMWHWNSLLRGENLDGKHFNHPPDGLYGSWYGHHNAPLEDPFSDGKQSICSQIEEIPKPTLSLKARPIPKAVVRQVRQILNSHPNGISLSCLRTELEEAGICLDKDYYGHKKLSYFLLSVADVQFHVGPDKGLFACCLPKNPPEPIESSFVPSMELVDNEELTHVATSKFSGEEEKIVRAEYVTPSAASSHELTGEDIPEKAQQVMDVANAHVTDAFCRIGGSTECVIAKSSGGSMETHSNNFSKRLTFLGWIKSWWPFRKNVGNMHNLTANGNKMVGNTEEPELSDLKQTISHSKEPELSNLKQRVRHSEGLQLLEQRQITRQFEEPELSELRQMVNHSGVPKLFSSSSFWSDMESFVFTSKGTILVSHSRSRKDIMHNFRKYGPQILRSLSENDLLLLSDLLISEKKWLEERPSQTFPFCIIPPVGRSSMGTPHGANGLRSLFPSRTTPSNLQKSPECEVDRKHKSIPHAVVSSPATQKDRTEKPRAGMLADVRKLVREMLREHPDGCNLGLIPDRFLQKYGYHLDVKKLGYQKLSSVIQHLPGVKIGHGHFFPAKCGIYASGPETSILKTQETKLSDVVHYYSDDELRDSYPEDDCADSPWEELGPVSVSNSNQSNLESKPPSLSIELKTSIHPDYEPYLSDDDSSESGGFRSCLTQSEEEGQPKLNVEDSSVLQILDSVFSSQEGKDSLNSDWANTECNGLTDGLNSSRYSPLATGLKIHSGVNKEKQKPQKSYSFVVDPVSHEKRELLEGVLQSLRKSDGLKMPN